MVVDDQRLIRQGLKMLLELEPDITVVAEAENGQDALNLYSQTKPDVVLMDVQMPILDGVKATRVLTERFTGTNVIVLTTFNKTLGTVRCPQPRTLFGYFARIKLF